MTNLDTNQITIPVPAVQGYFGKRIATYTTQIQAVQLKTVLGHDPRSRYWNILEPKVRDIYKKIQRETKKDRSEGVVSYLKQRFGPRNMVGAFPAVSIGVIQAMQFDPISDQHKSMGILHIDNEATRIMLDGLGRLTGCLDLAEESEEGEAIVRSIVLPVTFYAPFPDQHNGQLSIDDHGQLFVDFNFRLHPVPARIAIAQDQSDIYISLTNAIAKQPFIEDHGKMETRSASRGKKSTCLVVQGVLLRVVRGACEGRAFQEGNLGITFVVVLCTCFSAASTRVQALGLPPFIKVSASRSRLCMNSLSNRSRRSILITSWFSSSR